MVRRRATLLRAAFGLGLLALVFYAASQTGDFLESIRRVRPDYALVCIVWNVVFIGLGSVNIWLLLLKTDRPDLNSVFRAYHRSWCVALLLPARVGELSLVYYLRRFAVSIENALAVFTLDKLVTFTLYAAIPPLILLPAAIHRLSLWAMAAVPAGLVIVLLALYLLRRVPVVDDAWRALVEFLRDGKLILLLNAVVTLIKIAAMGMVYHSVFLAFSLEVSFLPVTALAILTTVVSFLPVSISGLGTVEAAAVVLFGQLGLLPIDILACYMFLRVMNYVYAGVLWIALPVPGRETKGESAREL